MPLAGSAYLAGSLRPAAHTWVAVYARLHSLDRAAAAEVRRAPLRAWPPAGPRRQAAAGRSLQRSRVDPGDRFCEADRFKEGPNRVAIVAVVLAFEVCDQGNLYRVLGRVTTRGWLVANFVDPYPSIRLAGTPDDAVRILGARDGR